MKLRTLMASLAILVFSTGVAFADTKFQVKAGEFDPAKTFLVQAEGVRRIRRPPNAQNSPGKAAPTGTDSGKGRPPRGTNDPREHGGPLLENRGPPHLPSARRA